VLTGWRNKTTECAADAVSSIGLIAGFARVTGLLYELRNLADYDPSRKFTAGQAKAAISDARQAITWFQSGTKQQQEAFLTLLLFRPR
jgi:hypothetical protein